LSSPTFNYPRLQWQVVSLGLPPTYFTDAEQASNVLQALCNLLLSSLPPGNVDVINTARRLTAYLRDNADAAVRGSTLGTQLQQVYLACDAAGASYAAIDAASAYLFSQAPTTSVLTQALYRSALVMNLGLESKIIARTNFTNQDQVQNMMNHVRDLFEQAKEIGIDDIDVMVYQALIAMGGAIINHLNVTQLQAPRYMTYVSVDVMPSLYLANRIYADASRSDEIEQENDVIHPAFMPTTIRVLSNVGS
jgi:prophage DNA circulation protein